METTGRAADTKSGEGWDVGGAIEEMMIANEDADGADERGGEAPASGGVDLNGDGGGGVRGQEGGGDPEKESLVPGGILGAGLIGEGAEFGGGMGPGDGEGVKAAEGAGGGLEALG